MDEIMHSLDVCVCVWARRAQRRDVIMSPANCVLSMTQPAATPAASRYSYTIVQATKESFSLDMYSHKHLILF